MDRKPSIIIVEDDEEIRETLFKMLCDEDYAVKTAKNGREAIDITNENFFNLALIDIRLPDIEGIKLLGEMRETTPRVRKVIITGHPSLQNTLEALDKGADAYIIKPIEPQKLLAVIKEQLGKQCGNNRDDVRENRRAD